MSDARVKVPCEVCAMKVPNGRMANHLFVCQAMHPYPCRLCTRCFSSPQGVANHQHVHSAEERGTAFRCTHADCDFGTNFYKNLQAHLMRHQTGFQRSRSRSRSRQPGGNPYAVPLPNRPPPEQPQEDQHQPEEEDVEMNYGCHPRTVGRLAPVNRSVQRTVERSQEPEVQQDEEVETRATPIGENIEQSVERSREPEVQQDEQAPTDTVDDDIEEIEPPSGFMNLRLVDPVRARLIMVAESRAQDDLVRNLRENNNILHEFCLKRGLDFGTGKTAQAIDVYFRDFSVNDD
uniref:C2H2-type domain-containing protein n=1 Tax=Meloidogyne hapla TaxID=6305 RepID=A0A1I8B866_MELHA